MRIHHLDCGSLHPFPRPLVNGRGAPWQAGRLVCHCLLVETAETLVLVDTGLGTPEVADPRSALGLPFVLLTRPACRPEQTAVAQVRALGHDPRDVGHVVLTHLDLDHAGGLADFPAAKVHVHARELDAATRRATAAERTRYRPGQWAHGPDWEPYDDVDGEVWRDLPAVRPLRGLPASIAEDLALVPLPGHTRGHSGVLVRDGERWLLHAGDAYFAHGQVHGGRVPLAMAAFDRLVQTDGAQRQRSADALRRLVNDDDVEVVCAHDPDELARLA